MGKVFVSFWLGSCFLWGGCGTEGPHTQRTKVPEPPRAAPVEASAPKPEVHIAVAKAEPADVATPEASSAEETRKRVVLGVDVLFEDHADLVAGKKVGLITNASGVDGSLKLTVERFVDDERVELVQLYSPEHGLAGSMRNGQSDKGAVYAYKGKTIPVQGLTGGNWSPSKASLQSLDVLVFDIQDIGSRTYTYITTLGHVMTAAGRAKIPLVVLDRPNPQGGVHFEGAVRQKKYKSFIGWGPLPVTHGMTVGELAQFYNGELNLRCPLHVVPMKHWKRTMVWQDTGLTWIPTSPGIPHAHNAQLYVATGMVGGSGPNVNEGGGNSMPFELIGALFVDDPRVLAQNLNAAQLPGVWFRPLIYQPWGRQFRNQRVGGVQLMLRDPHTFRPLRTALTILVTLQALYGEKMTVKNPKRFGRVWGNDWILPMIRAGKSVQTIENRWADELASFAQKRQSYLLYP